MAKAVDARKPRKPPSFPHLPDDRAKKLKRAWVEKQKIKSQWKAQKRKEGLLPKGKQSSVRVDEGGDDDSVSDGGEDMDEEDEEAVEEPGRSDTGPMHSSKSNSEDDQSDEEHTEDQNENLPSHSRPPQVPDRLHIRKEQQAEQKTSLRELSKQAYSRSSLHTHKADPLHRRRGSDCKGRGGSTGRGQGDGRAISQRGRGRGQPDMRLRMNVMLERIKRDFI